MHKITISTEYAYPNHPAYCQQEASGGIFWVCQGWHIISKQGPVRKSQVYADLKECCELKSEPSGCLMLPSKASLEV